MNHRNRSFLHDPNSTHADGVLHHASTALGHLQRIITYNGALAADITIDSHNRASDTRKQSRYKRRPVQKGLAHLLERQFAGLADALAIDMLRL